jgi:hypothetical protein
LGKLSPIGRLFALFTFLKITKVYQSFGLLLSQKKIYYTKFDFKNCWATFWAIFFTNSSGHPESDHQITKIRRPGHRGWPAFVKKVFLCRFFASRRVCTPKLSGQAHPASFSGKAELTTNFKSPR